MTTEYICKFKGDISSLEKALKKVNGYSKQLEDDEVLIKLNYDGNVAEFNKVFNQILKEAPELTIQFQYDANLKILEKEQKRLQDALVLKADIDSGDYKKKINEMAAEIDRAYNSAEDDKTIVQKVKDLLSYVNTLEDLGAKIDKSFTFQWEEYAEEIEKLDKLLQHNEISPIKLFDTNKTTIDEFIEHTENQVKEVQQTLATLRTKGATDKGSGSLGGISKELDNEIKTIKSDIADLQAQMDNMSGESFDKITLSVNELRDRLQEVLEVQKEITKQSINPNNISYHIGELGPDKKRWKSEAFHRMIQNMNLGDFDDGDFGFGILGTGVYHATDAKDLMMGGNNPKGYALNIDLSKYRLLVKQTNEEAEALMDFLGQLQGFAIVEGSGYEGWEETLKGVDAQSLYKKYTEIFKDATLDFSKFNKFLDDVIAQVKEASVNGIDEDDLFINLPDKFDHADSIVTQFLKKLGYEGIDFRGTDWDNYDQGSTVFDLHEEDILEVFETQEQMEQYWAKNQEAIKQYSSTADSALGSVKNVISELREEIKSLHEEIDNLKNAANEATIDSSLAFSNSRTALNNSLNSENKTLDLQKDLDDTTQKMLQQNQKLIDASGLFGQKSDVISSQIEEDNSELEDSYEHLGFAASRVLKEIGLSYDEYIKTINNQSRGLDWGERLGLIDSEGKVSESIKGTEIMTGWKTQIDQSIDRIIHSHPAGKGESEVFSPEDILEYYTQALSKGLKPLFELWQNNQRTILDFNGINNKDIPYVVTALQNIIEVVERNLKENGGNIPSRYDESYQQLYNSLISKIMDKYGGVFQSDKDYSLPSNSKIDLEENFAILEKYTKYIRDELDKGGEGNFHMPDDWSSIQFLINSFKELRQGISQVENPMENVSEEFKLIKQKAEEAGVSIEELAKLGLDFRRGLIPERNFDKRVESLGLSPVEKVQKFNKHEDIKGPFTGMDAIIASKEIGSLGDAWEETRKLNLELSRMSDAAESAGSSLLEMGQAYSKYLSGEIKASDIDDLVLKMNEEQDGFFPFRFDSFVKAYRETKDEIADITKDIVEDTQEVSNVLSFPNSDNTESDLRNELEKTKDVLDGLTDSYEESEKYATQLFDVCKELCNLNNPLSGIIEEEDFKRIQEIYSQFPELTNFDTNGLINADSSEEFIDRWFEFIETLPKAKEFAEVQDQISNFANWDEQVNSSGEVEFFNSELNDLNKTLQEVTGTEENFIVKYKEIIEAFQSGELDYADTLRTMLEKEFPDHSVMEVSGGFTILPTKIKETSDEIKSASDNIVQFGNKVIETEESYESAIVDTNDKLQEQSEIINDIQKAPLRPEQRNWTSAELDEISARIEKDLQRYKDTYIDTTSEMGQVTEAEQKFELAIVDTNGELQKQAELEKLAFQKDLGFDSNIFKNIGSSIENVDSSIEHVTGEVIDASESFEEVNQSAELIPLTIEDTIKQVNLLTASVDELNAAYNKANELLKEFASNHNTIIPEDTLSWINQVFAAVDLLKRNTSDSFGSNAQGKQLPAILDGQTIDATDSTSSINKEATSLNKLEKDANKAAESKKKVTKENKELKKAADDTTKSTNKETEAVEKLAKQIDRSKLAEKIKSFLLKNPKTPNDLKRELKDMIDTLNDKSIKVSTDRLNRMRLRLQEVSNEVTNLGKKGSTWFDKLGKKFGEFTRYLATQVSFYKIVDIARQGVSTVIELDTALTELRKVSDATEERLTQSFSKSAETGRELGATISDIIGVTADWSRLNKIGLLYSNV